MQIRRKTATALLAAALVAGVAGIGGAGTANAAPADSCSAPITHYDPGTYAFMNGTYNLKTGPYETCGTVTSVGSGAEVWVWCVMVNSAGHGWYYVRVAGTNTTGWMSGDNLSNFGGNFGYGVC